MAVPIADLRNTFSVVPNGRSAALMAVDRGFSEAAISLVFAPGTNDRRDTFFCCPPLEPDYELLSSMPQEEWLEQFTLRRRMERPLRLENILDIDAITRWWIFLNVPINNMAKALTGLMRFTNKKFVVISETPIIDSPIPTADFLGTGDFIYAATPQKVMDVSLRGQGHRTVANGDWSNVGFHLVVTF